MADALNLNLTVDSTSAVQSINTFFSQFDQQAAQARKGLREAFNEPLQTEVVLSVKGEKVAAQVKGIEDNVKKITNATKALNGEFGRTPNQIQKSIQYLKSLRGNTEKYDKATGKVTKSWKLVNQRLDEAYKKMKKIQGVKLGGQAGGMKTMAQSFTAAGVKANIYFAAITAGSQAVGAAISGMIQRSRELSQLETALKSFMTTQESVNATMELAQKTALQYGVSTQAVERAWKRVGPAANAAGLSFAETNEIITASTARMARMGLNAEQSGRYMEALAQVMGKNKLQGEELRQQFSELDGAMQSQLKVALRALYGVEDLDKAMQNGEVSAEMFAKALVVSSKDAVEQLMNEIGGLNEMMDGMNLEQKINTINNAFAKAEEQWGKIFGPFMDALARAGGAIAGYLATWTTRFPEGAKMLQDAFKKVGEFVELLVSGFIYLVEVGSRMFEDLIDGADNFYVACLRTIPGVKLLSDLMRKMGMEGLDESLGNFMNQGFDNVVQNARAMNDELGNMSGLFRSNNELIKEGEEGQQKTTEETKETTEAAEELKAELRGIEDQEKGLSRAMQDYKRDVEDTIADIKEQQKATERRLDAEKTGLEEVRKAQERANQDEIKKIEAAKSATEKRFEAKKRASEQAHRAVISQLDSEIEKIRDAAEASAKASQARIARANRIRDIGAQNHQAEMAEIESRKQAELGAIENKRSSISANWDLTKAALSREMDMLKDKQELIKKNADAAKDAAKSQFDATKQQMEDRYDREMQRIDNKKERIRAAIEAEKQGIDQLKDQINARYDAEISRLNQKMDKTRAAYNAEMAALNALTPAEKALRDIQVQKLKDTAANKDLGAEERLRAQAQLDDMERQLKIAQVEQSLQQQELQHEANIAGLEKARTAELEKAAALSEFRVQGLENELKALDAQKKVIKSNYDSRMRALETEYEAYVTKLEAETEASQEAIDRQIDALDSKEEVLQGNHQGALDRVDEEKEKIEEKYEAEKAEAEAQEEERIAFHEAQVARLEAEAQAEAQKAEDVIEALEDQKESAEESHEDEMERLEAEKELATERYDDQIAAVEALDDEQSRAHDDEMDRIAAEKKEASNRYADQIQAVKDLEKEAKRFYEDEKNRLDDMKQKANDLADANKNAGAGARNHAGGVDQLATSYNAYASALRNYASALNAVRGGGGGEARFAGGPVSGGSTYTVNEVGQEAFMNRAGKISMIKAPAFGQWKAPSSGTVIPAHVTSKMNIPNGGTSIQNHSSSVNTYNSSGSGSDRRMIQAIQSLGGMGGSTNNNVTIQASNPVQAASDMMVNLNRIKRNRLR